ncbi:MAG: hypothetical protein ACYCXW_22260 [Solirubrobacteraceae bacterium]
MVDAMKIAKRAKAMSTGYPEEAAMFDRKVRELAAANRIASADIERALAEIFGHRLRDPRPRRRLHLPGTRPRSRGTRTKNHCRSTR